MLQYTIDMLVAMHPVTTMYIIILLHIIANTAKIMLYPTNFDSYSSSIVNVPVNFTLLVQTINATPLCLTESNVKIEQTLQCQKITR